MSQLSPTVRKLIVFGAAIALLLVAYSAVRAGKSPSPDAE